MVLDWNKKQSLTTLEGKRTYLETAPRAHTTRNFVLRQGKKAFYEGNVLLWYLTGIKRLFDAGGGQKGRSVNTP